MATKSVKLNPNMYTTHTVDAHRTQSMDGIVQYLPMAPPFAIADNHKSQTQREKKKRKKERATNNTNDAQ